jgi:hypothetical protein
MAQGATKPMDAEAWWAVLAPCLKEVRQVGRPSRYQAICPLHSGSDRSLSVDLGKGDGVWYCHGLCQRGGPLQALALELGWVEFEDGAARVDRLTEPYEFLQLEPDTPFDFRVVRYETGLSRRPIDEPPGFRTFQTIRFHVPPQDKPEGPSYYDFTNLTLIIRVQDTYLALIKKAKEPAPSGERSDLQRVTKGELLEQVRQLKESNRLLEKLSPSSQVPLTLRLTRHGRGRDTRYDVEPLDA